MTTPQEDIAMRPTADVHVPTQQEDERAELMDAFVSYQLRQALIDAIDRIGEEEAKAIIEHELQHKQRMN